jgi:riboflavin kinase/FMN adenylyltransferase
MQVLEGLEGLRHAPPGSVMSIGNFDGFHLGHRHILEMAKRMRAEFAGARVAVVTFEPHPLTVLRPDAVPPRLSPFSMKRQLLEGAGVDDLIILPPLRQVLDLTAEQFWGILRDEARPACLIEGRDFTFGRDRVGTIDRLREWCVGTTVQLHVVEGVRVPLLDMQVVPVSSSLIRWLLLRGRVRDAAICLAVQGQVVEGYRRGRTIGVPTANLDAGDQLLPGDGVYAGRCSVDGRTYAAAISIGVAPTFGESRRQVEAHLIDFSGDLYGRTIQVELIDWTRDQIRFKGVDALKAQLGRDIATASGLRDRAPERAIARMVVG